MQNKINEILGEDLKKTLDIKTLLIQKLEKDNLTNEIDVEQLLNCLNNYKYDFQHYQEYGNKAYSHYFKKYAYHTNEQIVESFYNQSLNMYRLINRMEKFTNDIANAIGVSKEDLDIARSLCNYNLKIYIKKLNVYLQYSQQNIVGWREFFHITKDNVDIHNISPKDAFDLTRSSGTCSYSFSSDEFLLQNIIDDVRRGKFECKSTLKKSYNVSCSIEKVMQLEIIFKRLDIECREFIKKHLEDMMDYKISEAINIKPQEKIIDSAIYTVGDMKILFNNGRYSIDGLKLIKAQDWVDNHIIIDSVILSLIEGNANVLQLKKIN
jgi:hypothetical protein